MSLEYLQKQLGTNERILLSVRQHWAFLVKRAIWEILGFIAIIVVVFFVARWTPEQAWLDWGYALLLIPAAVFGLRFLQWRVKVYVVTNRRVARVAGLINKNVKDSSLEKVNDVVLNQSLFARIFGYGNIQILTASELGLNRMRMLAGPVEFKTAMVNAKEELEREFGHSS
jgi:uncharacterized membrane protein YdbT with pleckstrin-like domain